MNTQFISPDDFTPEKIEALFRSAMFYIKEHEPFSGKAIDCFVCRDDPMRILIGVNRADKLIHFQSEMVLPMKNHQWNECHWKLLNTLTFKFPMLRTMRTMNSVVFDYTIPCQLGIYAPSVIAAFRQFSNQAKDAINICHAFCSVTGKRTDSQFVEVSADNIDQMMADLIGDGTVEMDEPSKQGEENDNT